MLERLEWYWDVYERTERPVLWKRPIRELLRVYLKLFIRNIGWMLQDGQLCAIRDSLRYRNRRAHDLLFG